MRSTKIERIKEWRSDKYKKSHKIKAKIILLPSINDCAHPLRENGDDESQSTQNENDLPLAVVSSR